MAIFIGFRFPKGNVILILANRGLYSSNNAEPTQLHEDSGFILPADLVLLPHILGNNSYNTKFLGRWNLGQRPQANPVNFGFKSFQGTVSDLGSKYDDLRYPNIGFYRNGLVHTYIYRSCAPLQSYYRMFQSLMVNRNLGI